MKELKEFTIELLEFMIESDHAQTGDVSALAKIALAAKKDETLNLPLDYQQGHKDGLEWAARTAEACNPLTSDWLYDEPEELAAAIRKGPEMPPLNHTEQDGWVKCIERMPEVGVEVLMRISCNKHFNIESGQYKGGGIWVGAWCDIYGKRGSSYQIAHWMPLPASPKPEM